MLKDNYDVIFFSKGISAKISASHFAKQNSNVLLLDTRTLNYKKENNFLIYPHELPVLADNDRFYFNDLYSFIGLKNFKILKNQNTPLSIIFGGKRFYFHEDYIKHDILRDYPKYANKVLSFLDEIRLINEKLPPLWLDDISYPCRNILDYYNFIIRSDKIVYSNIYNNISILYSKHKIPDFLKDFFNAVIFVLSGIQAKNYPVISSVRLLATALKGVSSNSSLNNYIEYELDKVLEPRIEIRKDIEPIEIERKASNFRVRLNNYEANVYSKFIVSDYTDDTCFNFFKTKELDTLLTVTLNIFIDKDFLPVSMGEYTLFIDSDKSNWFSMDNLYVLRIIKKDDYGIVTVTSFLKSFDKSIYERMYTKAKKILPFIEKGTYGVYPNFLKSEYTNVNQQFGVSIFNANSKNRFIRNKRAFLTGRQSMPYFGFEGEVLSALKVSDTLMRKYF